MCPPPVSQQNGRRHSSNLPPLMHAHTDACARFGLFQKRKSEYENLIAHFKSPPATEDRKIRSLKAIVNKLNSAKPHHLISHRLRQLHSYITHRQETLGEAITLNQRALLDAYESGEITGETFTIFHRGDIVAEFREAHEDMAWRVFAGLVKTAERLALEAPVMEGPLGVWCCYDSGESSSWGR